MDPNIMKFFEEDEDETMHSGADVEAFTAELNRDIEGSASQSQQPSGSDSGATAFPKGGCQTSTQFPPQWQTSGHDGISNFQSELLEREEKEQHSSQLELHQHVVESESRKLDAESSHEPNAMPLIPPSNACSQPQDDHIGLPASQPMNMQVSGEQPINIQVPDAKPNPEREPQLPNPQNISSHLSVEIGSNNQQPNQMEFNNQQSLSTEKGNQRTSTGIGNSTEQAVSTLNQHATDMGRRSQHAITSGLSNQRSMTSGNQQPGSALKLNKQVPFGMLLPIIEPQLDKDRAMQLQTIYSKLKKNEISKDGFIQHMRSIVGDQMLKMAVYKLQTQGPRNTQMNPYQLKIHTQASARQHLQSDLSSSSNDSHVSKLHDVESHADSQGVHMSHMSTPGLGASSQDRKHPPFQMQGLNKQHLHFSQGPYAGFGSTGSSYSSFTSTNATSSAALRPQLHDSQMRQVLTQQNMAVNHYSPTTQTMMNIPKFERPNNIGDTNKIQAGNLNHMNSNTALQQNQVQCPPSTSKEHRIGVASTVTYVKQEPLDPSNKLHKSQMPSPRGISSLSSAQFKQGNSASGNLEDESFEMQSSRSGFTPSASLVPINSVPSSVPSPMETNILSNSRMPSLTSSDGLGNNSKVTQKKVLGGQKKPLEPVSSPPSSKKQKVSGAFLDQSIEHLNDVTAVSGVNLQEEEEQLLSGSKEDTRASEASRWVVQEEEERLILHKIPLQKKLLEIMEKCGLKIMSNDVERCLSLCVEERLCGLISSLIRLSKQRVDMEKPRHKIVVMAINRKAREEWEKKQAEMEKSQKPNEPESTTGADGDKEKDENRAKLKVNKEEDDKMRATAANVAVRAATGVGDMLSRWQLMIEAKQKQGGSDTLSGSQPSKDLTQKPSATSRNTKENQEAEKWDSSTALTSTASVRKVGRNQVVVPRVARSISVKDVIVTLEREPQMSKSTLLYQLYNSASADAVGE